MPGQHMAERGGSGLVLQEVVDHACQPLGAVGAEDAGDGEAVVGVLDGGMGMAHRSEEEPRPSRSQALVALLHPAGLLGVDVFRELSRLWGDAMKVLRCPKCNAATWDVHCIDVNCGWVVCSYCEQAVYEWETGTLMERGGRTTP